MEKGADMITITIKLCFMTKFNRIKSKTVTF